MVISPEATMRCKQWTDKNWISLTNELISMGYMSDERDTLNRQFGQISTATKPLQDRE